MNEETPLENLRFDSPEIQRAVQPILGRYGLGVLVQEFAVGSATIADSHPVVVLALSTPSDEDHLVVSLLLPRARALQRAIGKILDRLDNPQPEPDEPSKADY